MNKTWFIDIDGTLVKHLDESEIEKGGREELVPYAVEFMAGIQKRGDTVVLTTARPEEFRSITERIDYCTTIFRNDIYDEEFSPFCEEVANLGNHKNLDSMTKKHRKENDKVKKFIDGAVKTFVTVSDNKSLDILKDFVDFNEILINYITNRVLFNYERKDKFKYL